MPFFSRSRPLSAIVLCFFVHATPASAAQTIILQNGDRLTGTVERMSDGIVKFTTGYAGTLNIEWKKVREIRSDDEPMQVRLTGNGTIPTRTIIRTDALTQLDQRSEPTANVTQINPDDWETGKASRLSGEVGLAAKLDRGNTHENRTDISTRLEWKKLKHRVRLAGELEYDKTDGEIAQNRWSVETTYDNHFAKNLYYGGMTTFKRDRMTDLDLRWTIGPYFGWNIIDKPGTKLSIENGLEYTSETYRSQSGNSFIADAWRMEFSYFIIADKLELYHRNKGLVSLADAGGLSFDTWTGLKAPIASGLSTSAELKTSYNGDTPEGTVPWDTTWRMKLGYQW